MTEYAEGECATCGAIRPKNEMKIVSVRRVTGKSYGSGSSHTRRNSNSSSYGGNHSARFHSGSSNSNRSHSNTRTHMTKDRVWICKGCKAPKSDMSPTQRGFMFGALGIVAFFGLRIVGDDQMGQSQYQDEVIQQANDETPLADETSAKADTSEEILEQPDESTRASDVDNGSEDAATSEESRAKNAQALASTSSSSVDLAMQQAFQTGEPVRWEDGHLKGYAVPSAAEGSSGCRSVYYSIDEKEGWQSSAKTICP